MLHKIVEPDKTGDKYNVLPSHFLLYMLPKIVFFFHPFHQTRLVFRYQHISIIGTITIGVDMVCYICEIEIIMIIKKNFTLRSKDQYNACIN